jgi:hypothetical protein
VENSLRYSVDTYNDVYESYGVDGFLCLGNVGVFGGVYSVLNTDTAISSRFWLDGQMQYDQPTYSIMVMPVVGRINLSCNL